MVLKPSSVPLGLPKSQQILGLSKIEFKDRIISIRCQRKIQHPKALRLGTVCPIILSVSPVSKNVVTTSWGSSISCTTSFGPRLQPWESSQSWGQVAWKMKTSSNWCLGMIHVVWVTSANLRPKYLIWGVGWWNADWKEVWKLPSLMNLCWEISNFLLPLFWKHVFFDVVRQVINLESFECQ